MAIIENSETQRIDFESFLIAIEKGMEMKIPLEKREKDLGREI